MLHRLARKLSEDQVSPNLEKVRIIDLPASYFYPSYSDTKDTPVTSASPPASNYYHQYMY